MYKKVESYFKKNVLYNSFVHLIIGVGIGILITYPLVGSHPLRWGIGLFVLGLLGHAYPLFAEK